ncbi:MAG TPA: ABC transporter permease [Candidatus Dormibacteraeota bacterium]|nr:ABC transporter permease [Candidatus Dormibacteraeota bacterium]
MSARRVMAITRRILAQFRRDRRTLALLFVAPLLILSLLYFLLRGGGDHPALGVVNLDNGPLGTAIASRLQASDKVNASSLDLATADARLHDGRVDGYVLFDSSFTARAVRDHVVAPELHLEGSQPGPAQQLTTVLTRETAGAMSSLAGASGAVVPRLNPKVVFLYGGPGLDTLDYFGAGFIGLVVFFLVFVVTSVSFLRERSQGTLERLMASPLRRAEIVLGYMLGFSGVAMVQSAEVLLFALYVLKVHNAGNVLLIFAVEILLVIAAVNLGIFLSMFARTEFQAVQFIPLVIVPQMLLGGVIVSVSSEPGWLQVVSNLLPLTYAVNALRDIMIKGADLGAGSVRLGMAVMFGFCVLLVVAASTTLRRRLD